MQRNMLEVISIQEWDDPADYWEKYGPENNPEATVSYIQLDTFFEGLGILVKRGLIDPLLVEDLMAGDVMAYWEKMEPIANTIRERYSPFFSEYVEYLYNEVKAVYEQQHPELKAE